jgi:hypothetical protein
MPQSFCHASGSDHVKSSWFERRIHHGANAVVVIDVIDEQDSVQNGLFGWSHAGPPLENCFKTSGE